MLVARGHAGDTEMLLLGLSRANIERLTAGHPVLVRRETHGEGVPESWAIGLLFGETEQALADDLMRLGAVRADARVLPLPPEDAAAADGGPSTVRVLAAAGRVRLDFGRKLVRAELTAAQARALAAALTQAVAAADAGPAGEGGSAVPETVPFTTGRGRREEAPRVEVITGGQTGADQGALRAARRAGVPTGGMAPLGWQTEDGPAPWLAAEYGLVASLAPGYPAQTRCNVQQADALLWLGDWTSPGGTLTLGLAAEYGVPTYRVPGPGSPAAGDPARGNPADCALWLATVAGGLGRPVVLLVAGSRESRCPGIGAFAETFVAELLRRLPGLAAAAGEGGPAA